jgi:hypothetical protein
MMPVVRIRCERDDVIKGEPKVRRGFVTLMDEEAVLDYMGDFLAAEPSRVILHLSQSSGGNAQESDIASNLRSEDRQAMIDATVRVLERRGRLNWRWVANQRARTIQPSSVILGEPNQDALENFAYLAGFTLESPRQQLSDPDRLAQEVQQALNAILPDAAARWRSSVAEPEPLEAEPRLSILAGETRYLRNLIPEDTVAPSCDQNQIFEGVPGTGKSHAITELARSIHGGRVTTIVMHPATGYEDLVEGVRPANGELGSGRNLDPVAGARYFHECYGRAARVPAATQQGQFVVRAGHFLLACAKACADPTRTFLLVLDEINRCNVPRAFGELLLLIEPSKRWKWNDQIKDWEGEHSAVLPYSGLTFFVPDNLHVLGTMNTTDRSVAPLDQALRRRFAFHRLEPMKPHLLTVALGVAAKEPVMAEAIAAWNALNGELENRLGPDMMLGHSYFFDAARAMARGTTATSAVRDMWRLAILPQLIDILHTANRADLADHAELASHLRNIGLKLEPKGEGLHALLRVCASDAEAKA